MLRTNFPILGAVTETYRVTTTPDWSTNTKGGFYQNLAVPGILNTDNPIVDVVLGGSVSDDKNALKAWNCINRITTSDGSITLYAYEKAPSTLIEIQLKVVR